MFKSIKTKLIFAFIIINVIAIILTAFFARYIQKRFVIERAKIIAINRVEYLSNEIKKKINLAITDLFILRDLPPLHKFIKVQSENKFKKQELEKIFYSFAKYHKIFYQIRLLNNRGKELIRINFRKTPQIVPEKALQVKYHRYYFKELLKLKKGEVYISPFDLNIEHHKIEIPYRPVIRIGIPIFNKNSNNPYFLIVNVNGNIILNLFKSKNSAFGTFYLINNKGYFLYHPEKSKRFCFMFHKNETIFKCAPHLKKFLLSSNKGVKYFSEGIKHFSVVAFKKFKPIINGKCPEFTIIYSIFDPELLIGLNKYFKNFIIFTLVILIFCLIISTFIAHTISKPILQLANTTKRIKKGDFTARVKISTNDELRLLSDNFNEMTKKLENTIIQLKQSEEKYRNLFENTQDTVFLIDFQGYIKEINKAGVTLFGLEKIYENINIKDFIKYDFIEELKENKVINEKEVEIFRKNGEKRFGSIKVHIRDEFFIQGIIRDITDLKKRHEERLKIKRLIEEQIILAEERERRNIGQLIHEQLAQDIAFLHLKTEELYEKEKSDSILLMLNTTDKMLKQIRGTIFDLCPVILDEHGLISAIRCYVENFQEKTDIKVSFYYNIQENEIPINQTQKFYFFRIIKELLNNILKYAEATEVVISLLLVEKTFKLIVDDNGKGFEYKNYFKESRLKEGIGLLTIKKWVEHFNGNLYIESQIGEGTRVIIEIKEFQ